MKPGRPKKPARARRTKLRNLRFTRAEDKELRAMAKAAGKTVTKVIREKVFA